MEGLSVETVPIVEVTHGNSKGPCYDVSISRTKHCVVLTMERLRLNFNDLVVELEGGSHSVLRSCFSKVAHRMLVSAKLGGSCEVIEAVTSGERTGFTLVREDVLVRIAD